VKSVRLPEPHQRKEISLWTHNANVQISHLLPMRPLCASRPGILCISFLTSGVSRRPFLLPQVPSVVVVAHSVQPLSATLPLFLRRPVYLLQSSSLRGILAEGNRYSPNNGFFSSPVHQQNVKTTPGPPRGVMVPLVVLIHPDPPWSTFSLKFEKVWIRADQSGPGGPRGPQPLLVDQERSGPPWTTLRHFLDVAVAIANSLDSYLATLIARLI